MASRLTNDIRTAITTAALAHRFADEVKALIDAKAEFAISVWEDLYRKSDRQKMEDLPAGWLVETDNIAVQLGGSYSRLYFTGYTYGTFTKATKHRRDDRRRVLSKHDGKCAKIYPHDHKLTSAYSALEARETDLKAAYETASRQMGAALGAVTTVKILIETWPEIAPFASRHETDKPNLPALPTDQLNKILDLPVAEAA